MSSYFLEKAPAGAPQAPGKPAIQAHISWSYSKKWIIVEVYDLLNKENFREVYDYTVSSVSWDTYFLVNRVENQKLNQTTAELPFGWVFGFQLGLRQTQALVWTYYIIIIKRRRRLKH